MEDLQSIVCDLDYISLHDCVIDDTKIINNVLTLYFEHIDVLNYHPHNPFPVAKCAENAIITFLEFQVSDCIWYDTSKVKKNVIHQGDSDATHVDFQPLAKDFEILQVELLSTEPDMYVYKVLGICSRLYKSDIGEFTIQFKSVEIEWEKLEKDAWFVGFE